MFSEHILISALVIFLLRILCIALGTVRVLIMGRANKLLVAVIAFIEALTFVITFGQVAQDLNNIWNLMAYSLGFGAGTVIGIMFEERVMKGYSTVQVISGGNSRLLAQAIRDAGFGATHSSGEGVTGMVGMIRAVVTRHDVPRIATLVNAVDPKAFITVDETRHVTRGFIGIVRS